MAAPSRQSVSGLVKFPPTLGFTRTPEGMVARLANTLDRENETPLTIMFTGERAEIAERLLKTGGRLDIEGAFDPDTPDCFHVDRFDVPGSSGTHSYGIGDVNRRQEIVALDTTSATAHDDQPLATVTSISDRQHSSPPHPGELHGEPNTQTPGGTGAGDLAAEPSQAAPNRFQVGQRVRALDRGNLGTIVAIVPDGEDLSHHVRFVSASGMEATRAFTADQIEPAAQRSPIGENSEDRAVRPLSSHQPDDTAPPNLDSWTFETRPDGRAKLALPTTPPHEIRIRRAVDEPDRGDADPKWSRFWEAEVLSVDAEGSPCRSDLFDESRSQLVARALATLGELPSFEPYRTDARWTRLVTEFASDIPIVNQASPSIPTRFAGPPRSGSARVAPEPATRPDRDADHDAGPRSTQAPVASATDRSAAQPLGAQTTRPALRVLPVHTRAVDPQTGAISI